MIAGAALFGLGYVASAAWPSNDGIGWVPIAGSLALAIREEIDTQEARSNCELHCSSVSVANFHWLFFAMQAGGAGLFAVGYPREPRKLLRRDTVSLDVTPARVGSGQGFVLIGVF